MQAKSIQNYKISLNFYLQQTLSPSIICYMRTKGITMRVRFSETNRNWFCLPLCVLSGFDSNSPGACLELFTLFFQALTLREKHYPTWHKRRPWLVAQRERHTHSCALRGSSSGVTSVSGRRLLCFMTHLAL